MRDPFAEFLARCLGLSYREAARSYMGYPDRIRREMSIIVLQAHIAHIAARRGHTLAQGNHILLTMARSLVNPQ